jgi:hypothetical protein
MGIGSTDCGQGGDYLEDDASQAPMTDDSAAESYGSNAMNGYVDAGDGTEEQSEREWDYREQKAAFPENKEVLGERWDQHVEQGAK